MQTTNTTLTRSFRSTPMRMAATALALSLALVACGGGADEEASSMRGTDGGEGFALDVEMAAPEAAQEAIAVGHDDAGSVSIDRIDERIIRQAFVSVRLEAGAFDRAWADLRRLVADRGGFVASADTGVEEVDGERYAFGTFTVRVPADRFDDTLVAVSDLGERTALHVSSQDVGEEYVDLEARLRHQRALEQFHLRLLDEATTIDEAIKVQDRLAGIQLEIERIEGRLRYLNDRTSLATVTVELSEVPAGFGGEPSPIAEALAEARTMLLSVFGMLIVATAALIPLGLLALIGLGIWRILRRLDRRPRPLAPTP